MAAVSQLATLRSRVPFLHFFDGFRTSHEENSCELLTDSQLLELVPESLVREHRRRALSPEHPYIRGTAQNPDTYFQGRESANPYYNAVPGIVTDAMAEFAAISGRDYHLVDYYGDPEADRVVVIMGSGAQTVRSTVAYLNAHGEKVGVVQLRLYRPFPTEEVLAAIPASARVVAVLDRTKEPGAGGEPLFLDVAAAMGEAYAAGRLGAPADHRRRSLWLVQQGIHAGDGGRHLRRAGEAEPASAVHGRNQRRRHPPESRLRPVPRSGGSPDAPRGVLRPRLGWNRRREQELREDHRRHREHVRAGLLRLRLQEVGVADGLAPTVRAEPDRGAVPGQRCRVHRRPPLVDPRTGGRAGVRPPGHDPAGQHPLRADATPSSTCRCRCSSGSSNWASSCGRSTPTWWPARPAWDGGRTPSCRPASSRSARCCRRPRRSRR